MCSCVGKHFFISTWGITLGTAASQTLPLSGAYVDGTNCSGTVSNLDPDVPKDALTIHSFVCYLLCLCEWTWGSVFGFQLSWSNLIMCTRHLPHPGELSATLSGEPLDVRDVHFFCGPQCLGSLLPLADLLWGSTEHSLSKSRKPLGNGLVRQSKFRERISAHGPGGRTMYPLPPLAAGAA